MGGDGGKGGIRKEGISTLVNKQMTPRQIVFKTLFLGQAETLTDFCTSKQGLWSGLLVCVFHRQMHSHVSSTGWERTG